MRLVGDIDATDYLTAARRIQAAPRWLRPANLVFGMTSSGLPMFLGATLLGQEFMGTVLMIILISLGWVFIYSQVVKRLAQVYYVKHVNVPNLGRCTYEIQDDAIAFSGTTFDCRIPLQNIFAVETVAGTTLLLFDHGGCFLIPRALLEGHLPEFVSQIRSRHLRPSSSPA